MPKDVIGAGLEAMLDAKKPKPALVKPSAPKTEPSLYKAIRERLEAKDRETLHARTQKAVEAVESLMEGVQPVEERTTQKPEAVTPWGLEGLVVDPGQEAVGRAGFFWNDASDVPQLWELTGFDGDDDRAYRRGFGGFKHFAYYPNLQICRLFGVLGTAMDKASK